MNYSALKTLIDTEPANAGRTDQEVLDWCNEAGANKWIDVTWEEYSKWMVTASLVDPIEVGQSGGTTAQIKGGCRYALMTINAGKDLYASDSDIRAAFAAMSPEIIPANDLTDLTNLAQVAQTRTEEADLGLVHMGDVQNARAL